MTDETGGESHGGTALAKLLVAALAPVLGPVGVGGLTRLTGGSSRETWRFDAVGADGTRHPLILRRDPHGRPSAPGAVRREAAAMAAAASAGVAVPAVLVHSEDPAVLGAAGMVMRRIEGETIPRRILRDETWSGARSRLVGDAARALAGIHSVDSAVLGDAEPEDPVASLRAIHEGIGEPVPTFEAAFSWLEANRRAPRAPAVVHGDFRLGNLMVDEHGLAAVLDWELVHAGDPVEDLGWLCVRAWRFGHPGEVAGTGSRRELLDAYGASGGAAVDPADLHWWEVYGTLRWGVICEVQAAAHLGGGHRSVELAAIGRRVCEAEWDLLMLLQPDAARRALDEARRRTVTGSESGDLHGHPDAGELVEAVREFLVGHVQPSGGSVGYGARVAVNALATVERELRAGPEQRARRVGRLAAVGLGDERELAHEVRRAVTPPRSAELVAVLAEGVVDRLLVANPAYLDD